MRKSMIRGILLSLLVYLFAFSICQAGTPQEISVGILKGQKSVALTMNQPADISSDVKKLMNVKANERVSITLTEKGFQVNGKSIGGTSLEIRSMDRQDTFVSRVGKKSYRGRIRVLKKNGGLTVVNVLSVEDYLRGVVPKEMPEEWPMEALKVQAVAARSYALAEGHRHASDGYDVCDTTHCQVYYGVAGEAKSTDAAVKATCGEVIYGDGKVLSAPFHADSGGMTESNANVWGGNVKYLQSVEECKKNTYPWTVNVKLLDLERRLNIGKMKKIELSPLTVGKGAKDRTSSGRVKSIAFFGSKGTKNMSGNDFKSLYGLKSTLYDLKLKGENLCITGFGFGHGVGMSQYGAKAFAERGEDYRKILLHYYKNVSIKKLY